MIENKATRRTHKLEYILNTIDISDKTLTYMVEYFFIKRADIIRCMTEAELMKMKGE